MLKATQTKCKSFTSWLRAQRENDDCIGDLARDMLQDSSWPKNASTKVTFKRHLEKKHACKGAIEALEDAWNYYQQS